MFFFSLPKDVSSEKKLNPLLPVFYIFFCSNSASSRSRWKQDCQVAFEKAKEVLFCALILGCPEVDSENPFYICCDAGGSGPG